MGGGIRSPGAMQSHNPSWLCAYHTAECCQLPSSCPVCAPSPAALPNSRRSSPLHGAQLTGWPVTPAPWCWADSQGSREARRSAWSRTWSCVAPPELAATDWSSRHGSGPPPPDSLRRPGSLQSDGQRANGGRAATGEPASACGAGHSSLERAAFACLAPSPPAPSPPLAALLAGFDGGERASPRVS